MGISERKSREREEREARIVSAARMIAERDGWAAVTVRRLADEIEYSQPVLYSHFKSRDEIVGAVALQGFSELAAVLEEAVSKAGVAATTVPATGAGEPRRSEPAAASVSEAAPRFQLEAVATAYLDFAFTQPALYEAMFTLPTGLRFARSDTPPELRRTFGGMARVVAPFQEDFEVATEMFWAGLHGLAELERHGRIRPSHRAQRTGLLVRLVSAR